MEIKIKRINLPIQKTDKQIKEETIIEGLLSERSNKRQNSRKLKSRGEVRGGGRKPWRQKGTGRARHGSIRSPIWVGGGRPFASSHTNYKKKINKKIKVKIRREIFAKLFDEKKVFLIESKLLDSPSTKSVALQLKKHQFSGTGLFLYFNREKKDPLILSIRNISCMHMKEIGAANIEDLINSNWILMEQNAFNYVKEKILV